MSRYVVYLSVIALSVSLVSPLPASGQGLEVIGGLSVSALISSLENAAARLIDLAGARADMTLLKGAHAAELAIGQARTAYAESLDTTVEALDTTQRDTVVRLYSLVQKMELAFAGSIEEIAVVERGLSDTISRMPTVDRAPVVFDWEPLYFARSSYDEPIRVFIKGRFLSEGDPVAIVDGRAVYPKVETSDELIFDIPGEVVPRSEFAAVTLDLTLFRKERKWLVLSELQKESFRVTVYSAPPVLGHFDVYGKKRSDVISVERRRTHNAGCHAPHCKRCGTSERVPISEPNTSLVLGSLGTHIVNNANGAFSITDVSPKGFTMNYWAESYGCGPFWKGTRGLIRAYVIYDVEKRTKAVDELVIASGQELRWNTDVRVPLEELVDTTTVVLRNMQGGTEVLSPGEQGKFFEVKFDRGVNELIIRPRDLETALSHEK